VLPEVAKRDDYSNVDWTSALANVDWSSALEGVDWSTVDYNGASATSASVAAAPAVTTSPAYVASSAAKVEVSTAPVVSSAPVVSTTPVAVTTQAPPTTLAISTTAAASSAAAVATTSASTASSLVSDVLDAVQEIKLIAFGVISAGINAVSSSEDVWIGTDGDYTMEINNESDDELFIICWGPEGSWVNTNVPLVTLALPSGSSKTLSFNNGASGALSAMYSDTELVNGQVSNTWIEYTMGEEGVFDISREVNMNGHSVSVKGPECESNMTTCVFQCTDSSATSCEYGYELVNCANGSQKGATFGTSYGADSGGCGGLGSSAAMTATFS